MSSISNSNLTQNVGGEILITGDFDLPDQYPKERTTHLRTPCHDEYIYKHLENIQHYIVGGPEYVDCKMLSHAPNLKHLIVMGTGTSSFVDIQTAQDRNIQVDNTPGINADAVAEYALGAIIFNLANSFYSREKLLNGEWYQKPHKTLNETSFGIVGLGDIGSKFASKVRSIASNAEISYFSRTRKRDIEQRLNIDFKPLNHLSNYVDILIFCVTYNDDTHNMVDLDFIKNAKQGLSIFNFSNPLVVCPKALKFGLDNSQIKFAYFDGYYNEWVNNKGIEQDRFGLLRLGADKFIATSHIAAQANEVIQTILKEALKKIDAWGFSHRVGQGNV